MVGDSDARQQRKSAEPCRRLSQPYETIRQLDIEKCYEHKGDGDQTSSITTSRNEHRIHADMVCRGARHGGAGAKPHITKGISVGVEKKTLTKLLGQMYSGEMKATRWGSAVYSGEVSRGLPWKEQGGRSKRGLVNTVRDQGANFGLGPSIVTQGGNTRERKGYNRY